MSVLNTKMKWCQVTESCFGNLLRDYKIEEIEGFNGEWDKNNEKYAGNTRLH